MTFIILKIVFFCVCKFEKDIRTLQHVIIVMAEYNMKYHTVK